MRKYFIISLLAFGLIGCRSNRCAVDKEFVEDYHRHLEVVIHEERGDSTDIDEYRNTLMYFYKITGFLPRADYSSTIGYRDKSKYREDIDSLNTWLKKNKCHYTKKVSDSLLRIPALGQ